MPVVWVTGASMAQASHPDTLCRPGLSQPYLSAGPMSPWMRGGPAFTTRPPHLGPSRPVYVCLWILPHEGTELRAGLTRDRTDPRSRPRPSPRGVNDLLPELL